MEIKRWRRFGHDRLYFTDDGGTQIGWWDLPPRPRTRSPRTPRHRHRRRRGWLQRNPVSPPRTRQPKPLAPVPPPVPVTDIAHTLPGRQLFEHAAVEGPDSSWNKGIEGENVVANCLFAARQANPYWSFLNSVPVGETTDIDHVLMGPGACSPSTPSTTATRTSGSAATRCSSTGTATRMSAAPVRRRPRPSGSSPTPATSTSRSVR
ncbi:NERD domain-containing protein [Tessaracoccus sp. HDW20]|uniref:hypothetical protein n=1 Tax=Tessaracoccus coleopterorum TaxID=2714950 RepID=UPI0018D274CF|nr:hypothetical protein [Tessaracoccus coleopterorum]NHB84682.1 NERD domain-containing protein [Tessaracoccus coleopterorum]